jgi:hypothetical protein
MSRPTAKRPQDINNTRWRKLRARVLREATRCNNCRRPLDKNGPPGDASPEVDHVLPVATHPHLMWDRSNLQALCRQCNRRKGTGTLDEAPPQEGPMCAYYWSTDFYDLEAKAAAGTLTADDAEYLKWWRRGQEARARRANAATTTTNTRRGPGARSRRP